MTILDRIIERTREDLPARKREVPESRLREQIASLPGPRDFAGALRRAPDARIRVIAELKKASPSKGLIRDDFRPVDHARDYEANGAAALSVLTEPHFFQGSPDILRAVRGAVGLPLLRKDFIVDPYQILEARAWGADAVLLIAAALSSAQYAELYAVARAEGLAVLTEVHCDAELDAVVAVDPEVVGVNSRDLTTFRVDLAVTERLLRRIPKGVVRVAESGIHTRDDVCRLAAAGADAFLVGESLMREPSPGLKLRELLGEPGSTKEIP